jgi:hypothetical protein
MMASVLPVAAVPIAVTGDADVMPVVIVTSEDEVSCLFTEQSCASLGNGRKRLHINQNANTFHNREHNGFQGEQAQVCR